MPLNDTQVNDIGQIGPLAIPGWVLVPTGARVVYVRSTANDGYDFQSLNNNVYPTLAGALAVVRATKGDTIVVLPGHSESVTTTPTFVAGVNIIGYGQGASMPVFRWTATTSQWAISVEGVRISGLRLRMEGANGVVKAVLITAADCIIENCDIEVASGATAKATIAIEIGSAAHRTKIIKNKIRGTATHNVTDGIKVVGATTPNQCEITDNTMIASATAANGLIHVTVASLEMTIARNVIYNTHTASTACIAIDAVAANGVICNNSLATVNDGTASAQGITLGAGALFRSFENYSCDEPVKSGVLAPPAVAT